MLCETLQCRPNDTPKPGQNAPKHEQDIKTKILAESSLKFILKHYHFASIRTKNKSYVLSETKFFNTGQKATPK